jgi:hypothetical protein
LKKSKKEKSIPKLTKEAQDTFNAYIRQRDYGLPCISCGKFTANQAGHYFPVKGFNALRYLEINVNSQCSWCNLYQHGNQAMYRIGLVNRYGEDAVKELEEIALKSKQEIKKWSSEELNEIIKRYKQG